MRYLVSCHRYLSKHLDRPVTVEDVVAAYNEGPGNVVKAAYEWDNPHGEPNRDAWFLQVATGF